MVDGVMGSPAVIGGTFWRLTNKTHIMPNAGQQATITGDLYKVDIFTEGAHGGDTISIRVYRINGANYDFIGGQVLAGLAAGLNANVVIAPVIPVLAGDIIGFFENNANQGVRLTASAGSEDNKAGDITVDTPIAGWAAANWLSSLKGYIAPVEDVSGMMIFFP